MDPNKHVTLYSLLAPSTGHIGSSLPLVANMGSIQGASTSSNLGVAPSSSIFPNLDTSSSSMAILGSSTNPSPAGTATTSEKVVNDESDDAEDGNDESEGGMMDDADRIWSPDVEEALQEAVKKFPPCGRRKIMCEGRMYGRNELIARYIFLKTGKKRSRKQVSSHLQVQIRKHDRRLGKIMKNSLGVLPFSRPESAASSHSVPPPDFSLEDRLRLICSQKLKFIHFKACIDLPFDSGLLPGTSLNMNLPQLPQPIPQQKMFILDIGKTSDYLIQPIKLSSIAHKFPPVLAEMLQTGPMDAFYAARCWANFNNFPKNWDLKNFQVNTKFESAQKLELSMRTIVSSFGLPVIDKFETCTSIDEILQPTQKYFYEMSEIPMSWFSAKLASELAELFENSGAQTVTNILGNFSILLIIKDMKTEEILLSIAFVIECGERGQPPEGLFYRLIL